MKTTFEIQRNQWGYAVIVHAIAHDGKEETHSEGTHKTRAAAERAIRAAKYAAQMACADGFIRPRGM